MSGGGSQPTTTSSVRNTQATPYAPAIPYLNQAMQDAAKIYAGGPQAYTPWSQVAGFTPEQLAAQQGILNYAGSQNTQDFIGNTQNAVARQMAGGNQYLQPGAQQGAGVLQGYMANNDLQSNADYLNQMAYGDQSNPYLDTQVSSSLQQLSNKFMSDTLPGLRRAAIGRGSYGSSRNALAEGAAAGSLDAQMQQAANNAYMNDYAQQEQNRLGALGQIATQQNQQAQAAQGIMGTSANQYLQNVQSGLGNYKNAIAMPMDMLNQIYQVGTDQYAQAQRSLTDATDRWNYEQNQGWDQLARFKQLIDPTSSLGQATSSSSTSAQYPAPTSLAGNIAGGLLQAAPMAIGLMGGGGAQAANSGAIGSGTSNWATPSSFGFSNASTAAAPSMGASNFGGGIGSNTSWGNMGSFGFGGGG